MSEFERRKRYLKYNDPECVIFLRKDFNHQCAYCLIREADLGNPNNFQKDHFVPQNGGYVGTVHSKYQGEDFDKNGYYNLYYACDRCNGRGGKTNTWSQTLLDPCVDKIWDNHIRFNKSLVESMTPQGEEYITTFQLNSSAARRQREKISRLNCKIIAHINELEKAKAQPQCSGLILNLINEAIEQEKSRLKYGIKYIPNDHYYNDREIFESESTLKKYNLMYLNGDYELDYEIEFKDTNYKIYLRTQENIEFTKGKKVFYLPLQQVKDWGDKKVLICQYDSFSKKLYYIDFNEYYKNHPIRTDSKYMYVLEENIMV